MKKKIFAIVLCVAMLAIALVGGTLAYFTDTDTEDNVFTVGNVDIEILESTLHRDNDNATDEEIEQDAETYQEYLKEAGENMVPGRWVRKAPYIKNTGKNPAWVRVTVVQSKAMWETSAMMEYTTAQNNGAIVKVYEGPTADGQSYMSVYCYTEPVEPGEVTYYAPIWQFKIADSMNNAELAAWAEEEHVYVYADAIQAEGFGDYEEAFAAYDAQLAP